MFTYHGLLAFIGSIWQLAMVLGILLLFFGANRLPDLMRSLGRSVTEFKKGINESGEGDDDSKKIDK